MFRSGEATPRPSAGFTLIELLVVLSVIGLLLAILLPAVQSAREAARRASCQSSLRQVALAFHGYESANNVLPALLNGQGFSPHAVSLPYLEQAALFHHINFSCHQDSEENRTVAAVRVAAFLCPSDPAPAGLWTWGQWTSYAANCGWGSMFKDKHDGVFPLPPGRHLRWAEVVDGTSSTVMAAEWVHGSGSLSVRDPRGDTYSLMDYDWKPELSFFEYGVKVCTTLAPRTAAVHPWRGQGWSNGNPSRSGYTHDLGVNGRSCEYGPIDRSFWTAGSRHPGGAHAAYADGHVAFVRETTALEIWRAVGTRDGREIASID